MDVSTVMVTEEKHIRIEAYVIEIEKVYFNIYALIVLDLTK